jgi:hypothetical protein
MSFEMPLAAETKEKLEISLDELFSPEGPLVVSTSLEETKDLVVEAVSLSEIDIAELVQEGPSRSYATVKHTRAYHHIIALKLAAGEKAGVVARSLNLQPSTISRLLATPQFSELVASYKDKFVQQALDTYTLMEMVTMESVSALHERLIGDERDTISLEALRRISETFSDRTGHSPVRRSQSVNLNASGSISDITLERVKARHGEDAFYDKSQISQPALEKGHEQEALDQGAQVSIAAVFESVEKQEVVVASGEGPGV